VKRTTSPRPNQKVVKELQTRMEALDAEITENARKPWFKN
jgi:hypothetical protein